MVAVQWAGIYNDQVAVVRGWASHLVNSGNHAEHFLGQEIQKRLRPFQFSCSTSWLFVSIVLLGVASTIYTFACPNQIKEFTRSQWEHALQKNLVHYWGLAWKHEYLRYTCGSFYALGGLIFLGIMLWKLAVSFSYIIGYGELMPF